MKGGVRIRLPMEAVVILVTLYREGMTTNKRTDLVQRAVETTGLERIKVKNWIQNRRGKARRRDPAQRTPTTANFMASTAVNPLSMGSNPIRLYKRPRSASMGSLNLHHPHHQFTNSFKLKTVDKQHDKKDIAEKAWADVSQALAVISNHGYHFICSVYSSENNFLAVRSSGYGTTFLSTIQGDKGVENMWKAVEVLEKSKKRAAKLVDDVRQTGKNLPVGTNAGKHSISGSETDNDHEDTDSDGYEDDSDDADEETKASALLSTYAHRTTPHGDSSQSTHSAPETGSVSPRKVETSVTKRRSSASSTSAAMTLAALADGAFVASSAQRRGVSSIEPGLAPFVRPNNPTENPTAGTNLGSFDNRSREDFNSKKLPSPSEIVSATYTTGQPASQPPSHSSAYRTQAPSTAHPRPPPAWNTVGSALLNKQGAKSSFSHPLQQREIPIPGEPGTHGTQTYPYTPRTESNRMTEDNILPLPNIQSYNTNVSSDASAKHGRFGGLAP